MDAPETVTSHGARKGLADTALKTADAGYLTRKLVDVSQDVIISQEDCNTVNGIEVSAIVEGDEVKATLASRVLGRTALYEIVDPKTQETIVVLLRTTSLPSSFRTSARATGAKTLVVLDTKEANLHPRIEIRGKGSDGSPNALLDSHDIPTGAIVMVRDGMKASPGMLLAKTPREEAKTRDITGGLPRVAELFEARQPKDAAEISKIEGVVDFGENMRGKRTLLVKDDVTGQVEEHLIQMGKQIVVFKGDRVKKGQQLTEGPIIPQEILEVSGPQELEKYLVNEVQQVYRLQGVEINDKHIEIIVRQMLRKVRITNPGDTDFLWNEQITRQTFLRVNEQMMAEGRRPAEAQPALLGITKAALETDSFISAASFQDTTRVLTEAATMGRVDELRGFKENVILGHLIPGGTGFPLHRYLKLVPLCEPISDAEMEELRREAKAKLDALFGTTPIPQDEEEENEPAFQIATDQQFAQAPAEQAPDQTVDGYSADNDAFSTGDGE